MTTNTDLAKKLYQAMGCTFSALDCRKALMLNDGDLQAAANWLVEGNWMTGKLISWNVEGLNHLADELSKATGKTHSECFDAARKCNGCYSFALRLLQGLPPVLLID